MIKFPDYCNATNAAYETLIKYKEFSFPIGIFHIFRQINNVRLYTYDQLMSRFGISSENFLPSSDYGYNICDPIKQRYIVAYNSQKEETSIRFTLAHELGHVVLGHTYDGTVEDKEANCFARNLLCPIPVIKEMNLQTEDEYIDTFYVSEPMAYCAIKHRSSDYYYISTNNYTAVVDNVYKEYTGTSFAEMYRNSYELAYY